MSTGTCSPGEKQPGLWEVPLWTVQRPDSSVVASVNPAATKASMQQQGNATVVMREQGAAVQVI